MTGDSVDLPDPFGPMMAWISPGLTVSDRPWRISRSSTRTCRFLTSNNGIAFFHFLLRPEPRRGRISKDGTDNLLSHPSRWSPGGPSQEEALSDRTFQRDRNQLLCLDREFHRQLLQLVLHKTVEHEADVFFRQQAVLHAIEQHVLGD